MTAQGLICPDCGAEYRPGFDTCADCHVPLVTPPEPPDRHPLAEDRVQVASSLSPSDIRAFVTVLDVAGIVHDVQGEEKELNGPESWHPREVELTVWVESGDFERASILWNLVCEAPSTDPRVIVQRAEGRDKVHPHSEQAQPTEGSIDFDVPDSVPSEVERRVAERGRLVFMWVAIGSITVFGVVRGVFPSWSWGLVPLSLVCVVLGLRRWHLAAEEWRREQSEEQRVIQQMLVFAQNREIDVTARQLEQHRDAGGDGRRVLVSLLAIQRTPVGDLTFDQVAAIELASPGARDMLDDLIEAEGEADEKLLDALEAAIRDSRPTIEAPNELANCRTSPIG